MCLASPALSPFVKIVTHPEWAQDSEQCRKVTEGHPDATPPVFFFFFFFPGLVSTGVEGLQTG